MQPWDVESSELYKTPMTKLDYTVRPRWLFCSKGFFSTCKLWNCSISLQCLKNMPCLSDRILCNKLDIAFGLSLRGSNFVSLAGWEVEIFIRRMKQMKHPKTFAISMRRCKYACVRVLQMKCEEIFMCFSKINVIRMQALRFLSSLTLACCKQ